METRRRDANGNGSVSSTQQARAKARVEPSGRGDQCGERDGIRVLRQSGDACRSGDGCATGPTRAIRCGLAIHQALRDVGLQVRIGLYAGEHAAGHAAGRRSIAKMMAPLAEIMVKPRCR